MNRRYPIIDPLKTGQNIKRIMKSRKMSVRDIQSYLELSTPQGIYHWFEGRSLPSLDNVYALSELFRMPVDMLLIGNRKYIFCMDSDSRLRRLYAYYEYIIDPGVGILYYEYNDKYARGF